MPVLEQRDPFAPPADEEPTILGPLAERDPNAPLDESGEYVVTGAVTFDEVLRRTRRQGFVAGAAAGGLAGAVAAAVLALATARGGPGANAVPAQVAVLERAAPDGAAAPQAVASPVRPARAASAPAAGSVAARSTQQPKRVAVQAADAGAGADARRGELAEPPAAAAAPAGSDTAPDRPDAVAIAEEAGDPPRPADAPSAAGPPGERDVSAALAARRGDLEACVADTPGDGAAARGRRFRMLVVVEPSGQVSEARPYDEEIAATPLGVCLARLARETTFAAFEGEPARIELKVRADE